MFRRLAILWAVVLACGVFVSAAAVDPKQTYDRSSNALYNLDFNTAEKGYETLTREYPDNPDYWNALASAIWLKITFKQQKLNLESFSQATTFGTEESSDDVAPAEEKRFRSAVATAIAKADALLKKNPKDIHAMYEKGVATGTLASFEGTVKRAYGTAISDAKASKKVQQEVLKLDPTFDDARMSVGSYDYIAAVAPAVVRLLLSVWGLGSPGKDAGIQELETAAAKGKTVSTDAKMILSVVYSKEQRYDDALRVMSQLYAEYPRNFLFELSLASTYSKMTRFGDARHIYEQVLTKIQSKKDGYDQIRPERVYYLLGNDDIRAEQFDKAIADFSGVTAGKNATPDEKAGSYLWIGKIFDSKRDRVRAVEQYTAAASLNCSAKLKAEALQYKRRPFGEDDKAHR
jgi:tetratricopeptide (TPR) repeat protein